jgi:hypothetical protein
MDIILTSFIEGAPNRKEDSSWHDGQLRNEAKIYKNPIRTT